MEGKKMNFKIEKHELENTGGGCMVLFCAVRLPDNSLVYSATSYGISAIYATENEAYECYPETAESVRWFDEVENSGDEFEPIHKKTVRNV